MGGWSSSSSRAGKDQGSSQWSSVRHGRGERLQERERKRKRKNKTSPTDFMILIGSEGDSSIMDQWSLRSVLQGKEEKWPFASLLVLSQLPPSLLLLQCLEAE